MWVVVKLQGIISMGEVKCCDGQGRAVDARLRDAVVVVWRYARETRVEEAHMQLFVEQLWGVGGALRGRQVFANCLQW
jgi:hypothetical protein